MSQAKKQRLRLFERGNDRCPICLTVFSKHAVEEGKLVTLEHVPPRAFSGMAMCLTCAECNHSAGRVEQLAVAATKAATKVRVDIAGRPPLTAYISPTADDDIYSLRVLERSGVNPGELDRALRAGRSVSMLGTALTAHSVNVPWLKAAYLSVFSLLGVYGYNYAKGEAVQAVREQIMKPTEVIIPRFAAKAPLSWRQGNRILVSGKTPGWVVKIGGHIVLLPRGWDGAFYERVCDRPTKAITIGGGPLWFLTRFGANQHTAALTVREGQTPFEWLGTDLFGAQVTVDEDGKTTPFVAVDCSGREVTIMATAELGTVRLSEA